MNTGSSDTPRKLRVGNIRGSQRPPEWLVTRVRGEFFEMPGLRLTFEQACPLWQMDASRAKSC
jgi:hypothetical protein